jgi:hypothetical protein
METTNVVRWLIAAVAALGVVAMLAYVRNDPGVGKRFPDPEDVHGVVVIARADGEA